MEQVLKGMSKIGILKQQKGSQNDLVYVMNPEELKHFFFLARSSKGGEVDISGKKAPIRLSPMKRRYVII